MNDDGKTINRLIIKLIISALLFFAAILSSLIIPCSSGAGDEKYLLDITGIRQTDFPTVNITLFFRNTLSESISGLLNGNFSLYENKSAQSISVDRINTSVAVAFVVDESLCEAAYEAAALGAIQKAASYLEGLDRMALVLFRATPMAVEFTYSPKNFEKISLCENVDYSKTPDEILSYSIDKILSQHGARHIIYVTRNPISFDETILDRLYNANSEDSLSVSFVKLDTGDEVFSASIFKTLVSEIASRTSGMYAEKPLGEACYAIETIMNKIKSNYRINFESSQPYSNGRMRQLNLSINYRDTTVSASSAYGVNFNLPELNFGMEPNPVYYQELDPATLSSAKELGLALSASVKFSGNDAIKNQSYAYMGFGEFGLDGNPSGRNHYILRIDNRCNILAARYNINGASGTDFFKNSSRYADSKERIEANYAEKKYLYSAAPGLSLKRAGIYWTPFLKDLKYNPWVRFFISFAPDAMVLDGTKRYAVYLSGQSQDGAGHEIGFEGIQLQYGPLPTIFTDSQTIYLGPDDINKSMVQPVNPRIEYQMK